MGKQLKIKDKYYEIEDPTDFFLDLFSFRRENKSFFPTDHWELILGAIVGGMGSGKSTLLQFITALGKKIYGDELSAYHTDSILATLKYLNANKQKRTRVLFLYLDDALTKPGADSRRSISAENVQESQNLSIIRHLLANENENGDPDPACKNGFCVLIYAVQDLNRLDAFVRRNLHFIIYKSYYQTLERELNAADLDFLKMVTENSIYRHNYEARGYCVMTTLTGATLKLFFPKIDEQIEKIYSESIQYEDLINAVLKLDLDETKDSIVRGFIREYCFEHRIKSDSINIPEIIDLARYRQWKMKNSKENMEEDQAQLHLTEIERKMKCASIHEMLAQGKTMNEICKKISISKGWFEYHYPRWCKSAGIKPIQTRKLRKNLREIEESDPTIEVAE